MSMLRSLRVRLGTYDVGSLFALDDGRVYFRFDDAYVDDPQRPVLSQLYLASSEERSRTQLRHPALAVNRGDGKGGLPPFFQNLLPEGQLRHHLIERAGIEPNDEFGLLAFCGRDLPGNVIVGEEHLDEKALGRLIGQSFDSYELSSAQMPTPDGASISGVQPKVSLVKEAGGHYVMRSRDNKGRHFIGKLPASDYPNMPEVEFSSLTLAAAAGVNVCEHSLLPLSAIADHLPFGLRNDAQNFLLIHRFDRDAATVAHDSGNGRLHMEDFAQITGTPAADKYSGTYAALGVVLLERSREGENDLFELLRRIKVNELLGNFDAHLKNFSMLYTTPHSAQLSPAYDIVAYSAYLSGHGHALAFCPGQKTRQLLTPAVLRALSNIWKIPEPKLQKVLIDTVARAMDTWPQLLEALPLSVSQRSRISEYLQRNPSVMAWQRRAARKSSDHV